MKCRHCGSELKLPLVDLGSAPPSNAYLTAQTLHAPFPAAAYRSSPESPAERKPDYVLILPWNIAE